MVLALINPKLEPVGSDDRAVERRVRLGLATEKHAVA